MSHPEHPRGHRPPGRTDPTHPPRLTGRAAHRHLTGRSTTRSGTRRAARPRTADQAPTPASVWTFSAPVDPDARWPTPVLAKIVTSFTDPGAHVVLLAHPESHDAAPDRPRPDPDSELDTALDTIHGLHRAPRILHLPPPGHAHHPPDTRPHQTEHHTSGSGRPGAPGLVGHTASAGHPANTAAAAADPASGAAPTGDTAGADLIIASLAPGTTSDRTSEQIALTAAQLLRTGGILTVLTHSDWTGGRLRDPTGPLVTAGQNADLLYLQHIVTVHAPLRDGRLQITPHNTNPATTDRAQPPSPPHAPVAHRRLHSDLTVLMQPRDHLPAPPAAATDAARIPR